MKIKREELWMQLTNAVNLRSSQDQVLWSIFGTFWAANAILLVALFTGGTRPNDSIIGIVISSVGVLLSLTWHVMQNRALGHLMRHETLITQIETKLGIEAEYAVSAEINRQSYKNFLGKGFKARTVMKACSIGGSILWFGGLVVFLLEVFN